MTKVRSRSALYLGLLLGVGVLVVAGLYLAGPGPSEPGDAATIRQQSPPAADVEIGGGPAMPSIAPSTTPVRQPTGNLSWPVLPDSELPLSQQLPILLQRADLGDPIASCRLIIGINRCIEFKRNQAFSDEMRRSLESREGRIDGTMIGMVASSEERKASIGSFCDALQLDALPRVDDLLRRALGSLSPRQKTTLAMMRSDGELSRLRGNRSFSESGLYVIPQFIAERTHEFLMSGYQARDPLALEGLVMLHSPGHAARPMGVAVWLPNPRLFLQYAGLMDALYGPGSLGQDVRRLVQATAATMTPQQLELVQQYVQAEQGRWTRDIERRDANRPAGQSGPDPTTPGDCLG